LEYGGLVFVYMGPPGSERLFRCTTSSTQGTETMSCCAACAYGASIPSALSKDCNWLQHYENIVDPWHLLMLHQMISGDQFEGALMQGAPQIGFENTSLGRSLPGGQASPKRQSLCAPCGMHPPNAFLIPNIRETVTMPKRKERCTELSWAVPIDNEHVTGLSIVAWPFENGQPKKGWRPGTDTVQDIRPGFGAIAEI
jgi:hypothetical protein